ncbi:MAG: DUF3726 domain-containing protein [Pseudomonadota bacterium]
MTYSLGEVEALSRKAARGAGFSWGMAEDAGKAVRWLCNWGLPGAEALAGYLDARRDAGGPSDTSSAIWSAQSGTLCPITCGTVVSDRGALDTAVDLHALAWPLLIVPHVAWIAPKGSVSWPGSHLYWDDRLRVSGPLMTARADQVTLSTLAKPDGTTCQKTQRADLDDATLSRLTRFAAKTYAPETEASKTTGAGAGLTDGD